MLGESKPFLMISSAVHSAPTLFAQIPLTVCCKLDPDLTNPYFLLHERMLLFTAETVGTYKRKFPAPLLPRFQLYRQQTRHKVAITYGI